jgi:CxxC motif-containing protein (DUF1111 family)
MSAPPLTPARLVALAALVLGATGLLVAQARETRPGDPLPGVSAAEFEEFRLGQEDFLEVETAEEGLGPAFNATSCAVCHSVPAVGGISAIAEVRAGHRSVEGVHTGLDAAGESLVHLFSLPGHACQPVIPATANIIVRRVPLPLFGAGLVEAIADETVLALADPDDRDGDGVSGRAAIVEDRGTGDRRVGRFGWKAQHATLLAFSADAYRNEMGITNDLFKDELAIGIDAARMRACDPIPEPEDIPNPLTRRRGIDNFASFMRLLAPVDRAPGTDVTREGERVFHAIGCAACHVPALPTGSSRSPLFDRRSVPLFSDLLLHEVGTGDGIRQASAEPDEIRTPALWGLRHRRPLLHDGSAATIADAILRHGGEAARARAGVDRLGDDERAALLAFLATL